MTRLSLVSHATTVALRRARFNSDEPVDAIGLTILRSRLTRTRAAVVATMVTAMLGLVNIGVLAALLHPDWRPTLVVVLAVVAAAVLTVVSIAPKPRVRLGRLADALELTGTIALLPLAVVTAGIIGLIRS